MRTLIIKIGAILILLFTISCLIRPRERPHFNSLVVSAANEGCFDLTEGEVREIFKDEILRDGMWAKYTAPSGGIAVHEDGGYLVLVGLKPGVWPLVASNRAGADTIEIRVRETYTPPPSKLHLE